MYTVQVQSEFYSAGISEDGFPIIAESYFVAVYDEDLNCWRHRLNFDSVTCTVENGTVVINDQTDQMREAVDSLLSTISHQLHHCLPIEQDDFIQMF